MATFWERAARSVNSMLSLLYLFVALVVSQLCFEGRTLVLIVSVHGHCLPLYTITVSIDFPITIGHNVTDTLLTTLLYPNNIRTICISFLNFSMKNLDFMCLGVMKLFLG